MFVMCLFCSSSQINLSPVPINITTPSFSSPTFLSPELSSRTRYQSSPRTSTNITVSEHTIIMWSYDHSPFQSSSDLHDKITTLRDENSHLVSQSQRLLNKLEGTSSQLHVAKRKVLTSSHFICTSIQGVENSVVWIIMSTFSYS